MGHIQLTVIQYVDLHIHEKTNQPYMDYIQYKSQVKTEQYLLR